MIKPMLTSKTAIPRCHALSDPESRVDACAHMIICTYMHHSPPPNSAETCKRNTMVKQKSSKRKEKETQGKVRKEKRTKEKCEKAKRGSQKGFSKRYCAENQTRAPNDSTSLCLLSFCFGSLLCPTANEETGTPCKRRMMNAASL